MSKEQDLPPVNEEKLLKLIQDYNIYLHKYAEELRKDKLERADVNDMLQHATVDPVATIALVTAIKELCDELRTAKGTAMGLGYTLTKAGENGKIEGGSVVFDNDMCSARVTMDREGNVCAVGVTYKPKNDVKTKK